MSAFLRSARSWRLILRKAAASHFTRCSFSKPEFPAWVFFLLDCIDRMILKGLDPRWIFQGVKYQERSWQRLPTRVEPKKQTAQVALVNWLDYRRSVVKASATCVCHILPHANAVNRLHPLALLQSDTWSFSKAGSRAVGLRQGAHGAKDV